MCGIFGMIGDGGVASTLAALKSLEYRGYDSAGIAANRGDWLEVCKTEGRIAALCAQAKGMAEAQTVIGHTRWATHGAVCKANAHPFVSADGAFAIVHNGIIENYRELKDSLGDVVFTSQTDSETVAHLLQRQYAGNVLEAVLGVARQLKGSFAIAVTTTHSDKLYAVKSKSPLVVGRSQKGAFLCSDVRCLSRFAKRVAMAPDGTVVEISRHGVRFFDFFGKEFAPTYFDAGSFDEAENVQGDFMLKEISEIPDKLRLAQKGYDESGGLGIEPSLARSLRRVYLIGCGTAYNSGLQTAAVARKWLDMDVVPVIASEFIYDDYPVDGSTLAFFISQSGETADTVRAAERVRDTGGHTFAVTNTQKSSLTFVCERTINIFAGSEYAVASTKAYNCQLMTLSLLLAQLAVARGTLDADGFASLRRALAETPSAAAEVLSLAPEIKEMAQRIKNCSAVFFIGRTADYPTACEGSLKLKEISYVHSEAYPAGELKHGTLALMEPSVAVVIISTDQTLADKTLSTLREITSRGAQTVVVAPYAIGDAPSVLLPKVHPQAAGIVSVVALQLLAYYTAKALGRDVDKPRNLAKSVTVE